MRVVKWSNTQSNSTSTSEPPTITHISQSKNIPQLTSIATESPASGSNYQTTIALLTNPIAIALVLSTIVIIVLLGYVYKLQPKKSNYKDKVLSKIGTNSRCSLSTTTSNDYRYSYAKTPGYSSTSVDSEFKNTSLLKSQYTSSIIGSNYPCTSPSVVRTFDASEHGDSVWQDSVFSQVIFESYGGSNFNSSKF